MEILEAREAFVEAWCKTDAKDYAAWDVVKKFVKSNPALCSSHTDELIFILEMDGSACLSKHFVVHLLNHYDSFESRLMAPLLNTALVAGPSANRDFLQPCLNQFGAERVIDWLIDRFRTGTTVQKIGVSDLIYWLDGYPVDPMHLVKLKRRKLPYKQVIECNRIDSSRLEKVVSQEIHKTNNVVELYFYYSALRDKPELLPDKNWKINCAHDLKKAITGNQEYEKLLYEELNWSRD